MPQKSKYSKAKTLLSGEFADFSPQVTNTAYVYVYIYGVDINTHILYIHTHMHNINTFEGGVCGH